VSGAEAPGDGGRRRRWARLGLRWGVRRLRTNDDWRLRYEGKSGMVFRVFGGL